MASKTLGRVSCPINCGHTAAQVKLKTDKEAGKAAYPYVHCAGCGTQLHTRNQEQAEHLLRMTRPEGSAPGAPQAAPVAAPVVAPVAAPVVAPPVPEKPPVRAPVGLAKLFASPAGGAA